MTASGSAGGFARPSSRRRALAASAVCAGHVLVLLAAWQIKHAAPRDTAEVRRLTTIRLLPERRERAARAPAIAAHAMALPRLPEAPAVPADVSSLLIPVPAIAGSADTAGRSAGSAAVAPGAAASGPAPLQLKPHVDVLRGSLASLAANDPRANTPRPTFEERIAMGADPQACVKVERLPDGSVRRSMGRLEEALSTMQATFGVGGRSIKTCR